MDPRSPWLGIRVYAPSLEGLPLLGAVHSGQAATTAYHTRRLLLGCPEGCVVEGCVFFFFWGGGLVDLVTAPTTIATTTTTTLVVASLCLAIPSTPPNRIPLWPGCHQM